jgi:pyridoxamine 5'-phosphate oxidase
MEILRTQDPITLFQEWFAKAKETEPNDPEAMALATTNAEGMPSVRMVLLKDIIEGSFVFYTNMESRKGEDLAANARAALCFHWKSQGRQVRVEGKVSAVGTAEADAYFKSRHPLSRLGAWASRQSQPLESRAALEARVAEFEKKFAGLDIPRPPRWGGYRVEPEKIEFWQEGAARLHDRFLFTKTAQGWDLTRLNP